MEQTFEAARNMEAIRMMQQRRQSIVAEQEQELKVRDDRNSMKVAFRKSDEEERLVSILSKQIGK